MKVILAIVAITVLETIALIKGVDGSTFGIAIAAISGLSGYGFYRIIHRK